MNVNNVPIKTYSPANMFKFVCPIFSAEVEIRQCLQLRDMVWKGRGPEVRKGCQACMSASKCPVVRIVQKMTEETDIYYSPVPKVGHLHVEILNHIAPITVTDSIMQSARFDTMTDQQRKQIAVANEAAKTPLKKIAPKLGRAPPPVAMESLPASTLTSVAAATPTTPGPAAMDYADLVNATMERK